MLKELLKYLIMLKEHQKTIKYNNVLTQQKISVPAFRKKKKKVFDIGLSQTLKK